jgi:FtsK/SpoIIIE family
MSFSVIVTTVDGDRELDLIVEVADATITVSQLGLELGLGDAITIDGRVVQADLPVTASGLVAGSRLGRAGTAVSEPTAPAPIVTLYQIGGLAAGGCVDLPPGRHAVGASGPARSELQSGIVAAPRFHLEVTTSGEVSLITTSVDRVVVDGVPVPEVRALRADNIIDVGSALFRVAPCSNGRRRFGNARGLIEINTPEAVGATDPPEYVTPPNVDSLRRRERSALQQSSHPVHATFRNDLARAHQSATLRARRMHADTGELRQSVSVASADLWTQRSDMPLQLGHGDVSWTDALVPGSQSPDELSGVLSRFSRLPSVPLMADLSGSGLLTLAGPRHAVLSVARWVILQSASRTDPASLSITVASSVPGLWEWTKWLPHCAAAGSDVELIIADGAAITTPPHGKTRLIVRLLSELEAARATAPVTRIDADGHIHVDDVDGLATGLSESTALAWARALAPLVVTSAPSAEPPALRLDRVCGLAEGDGMSDEIVSRWRTTVAAGAARIPFGADGSGLVALDLAITTHMVISGPAGSGRSTALANLLLSLALNHPPDSVEVIAIDAGTEGTFDRLCNVPHLRTWIVGLDDLRTTDTLERLASNVSSNGVRISSRRTVLFVDDATTLAAAVPGAAAALAILGQRSVGGPHLILATRRPEGLFAAGLLPSGAAHLVLGPDEDARTTLGMIDLGDAPWRVGQARWAVPGTTPTLVQVATVSPSDADVVTSVSTRPFISARSTAAPAAPGVHPDPTSLVAAIRQAARSVGVTR